MSIRRLALAGWDCIAWTIGLVAGMWLRLEANLALADLRGIALVLSVALATQIVLARPLRLYRVRSAIGTMDEAVALSGATALTCVVTFTFVMMANQPPVPRSVPLIAAPITFVVATGGRAALRLWRERRGGRDPRPPALRDVTRAVTGAGLRVTVQSPLPGPLGPDSAPGAGTGATADGEVALTDLLGRGPVEVDVNAVAGYLTGKRVLVTGAGGSIGSELCRQIHRLGPAELIMLDRDESTLHATRLSVHGSALLDSPDIVLADIRDADVLAELFADRRPEVVFHAAALKHLPVLERFPEEAWRTNVLGTQNVLRAAAACGAAHVVNISTDKAANPTSVLGRSKRIGERLVAACAHTTRGTYLSVRFGNVLGSRGSVLSIFTEQIAAGGPVTITDPDVTRFLMTIPEAVQLVVHAAAIGRPGEVLVLDMGEPVRIADIARQLMHVAGRRVDIVYTGLREGEKLHEELFGDGERDWRPTHPAVSQVPVPPLPMSVVRTYVNRVGAARAMIDLPHLGVPVDPTDRDPGRVCVPAVVGMPTPRPAP